MCFWFYAQQKKNTSLDSTNIMHSLQKMCLPKQLISTERETSESYLCFGWHPLYPFLPISNFSFTQLYFKMFLERFLNDPHPPHRISSLFYCYPHSICHPCPTPKVLIFQQYSSCQVSLKHFWLFAFASPLSSIVSLN